ncbi:hypothetical protein [Gimesia maris]|jgi:hypothetical protein|uniref:Uncharacterized protein n=1 Tax=Gimesia maris TaxID=122 RepID=A0A3D3R1L8_9PLAN|nr:hypothetical protein [Gimesia maris]MAC56138.1 hypothetical protein [Gimesia sp.]QDT77225.1 hypothetical protein Mal35_06510 [Gimesia maris]HCO22723.1 hypothetical protein [Gimesia maris]|tara:strand:- start:81075 stop:81482 length:408 start_codon:yes stop_codon:yes gene_type:complete
MDRDQRHLQLLSKLQIIYGILNIFVTLIFYWVVKDLSDATRDYLGQTRPELEVSLMIGFGVIFYLIGFAILFCIILAGQSLARYENYRFCLIVAICECPIFPFGTLLGIATIVVLLRDSVKQLFLKNSQKSQPVN